MKRSCETCLWWDWDKDTHVEQRRGSCRCFDPPAHFLPAVWPITLSTDWCYKWEPRDRSLVRCETCEWWRCTASKVDEHTLGFCQYRPRADERWPETYSIDYCAHWRLREERDDA